MDNNTTRQDVSNLEEAYKTAVSAKDDVIKNLTYLTELMQVCYDEYYHLPPKVKQTLKTITDRFNGERCN